MNLFKWARKNPRKAILLFFAIFAVMVAYYAEAETTMFKGESLGILKGLLFLYGLLAMAYFVLSWNRLPEIPKVFLIVLLLAVSPAVAVFSMQVLLGLLVVYLIGVIWILTTKWRTLPKLGRIFYIGLSFTLSISIYGTYLNQ